jgi:hypothetical protein
MGLEIQAAPEGLIRPDTVGDRETWASLPVLFWRVSLAALSSREPGERPDVVKLPA